MGLFDMFKGSTPELTPRLALATALLFMISSDGELGQEELGQLLATIGGDERLLDNALKYSPADAPVELHARINKDDLILTVSDQGPGIAPAWREKVFEVFQRGDSQKLEDQPDIDRGAGVGLAVCRAIARAHHGDLLLRARGEGGCLFECSLPLRGRGPCIPDVDLPEAH